MFTYYIFEIWYSTNYVVSDKYGIRRVFETQWYITHKDSTLPSTVEWTGRENGTKLTEGAMEVKLARFLFYYRVVPHSTTGMSPAELMFGQQLRTRFDILQPGLANRVCKKQEKEKRDLICTLEIGGSLKVIMFMLVIFVKWLGGISKLKLVHLTSQ